LTERVDRLARCRCDGGSIMVLVIGYAAIAMLLMVVGVDVSKVFLAQRALSAATDSAALAAAQGVDRRAIYAGGLTCGKPLPLDGDRAVSLATAALAAAGGDLDRSFATLADPQISVDNGTASVVVSGEVSVPFGAVLGWLDPAHRDGLVRVSATSYSRSPVAGGTC
jgi:uncharacterized membrane protein